MEAVEVIESPLNEDCELDIPDNVIHIIFHQTLTTEKEHSYKTQPYDKIGLPSQRSHETLHKKNGSLVSKNFFNVQRQSYFDCSNESNSSKIMISTKTAISKTSKEINTEPVKSGALCSSASYQLAKVGSNTSVKSNIDGKVQIFQDAVTQTDIRLERSDDIESLNLFFCTFYPNREVETYCDIPALTTKNITIQEPKEEDFNRQGTAFVISPSMKCGANEEKTKEIKVSETPLEHRKRRRRKAEANDNAEVLVKEELSDDIPPSKKSSAIGTGYALRTQRLSSKRFGGDMFYSFGGISRRRRAAGGVCLRCCHCPEEFLTFRRLEKHTWVVHGSKSFSFPCDICGATFTRPHNLERHKETRHRLGEKRFLCEVCGRRFSRQDILAAHTNLIHSKVIPTRLKPFDGKRPPFYRCPSCNKCFSRLLNFSKHQKGNLSCPKCLESFACKTNLQKHVYQQHSAVCNICDKVCTNRQQLYFHKMSHTPRFNCKYCNKGFTFESQFVIHLATHTGNKPLRCEICAKPFAHKNSVNKHRWQEHTDASKRFPCKFCPKSFVYKAKLESHLRSHTGEKPFVCHLCPSSFSHNCNLSAHIKSVHASYNYSIKKDGQKSLTTVAKCKKKLKSASTTSKISADSVLPLQAPVQRVSVVRLQTPSCQMKANSLSKRVVPIAPRLPQNETISSEPFTNSGAIYQILYTYPTQDQ